VLNFAKSFETHDKAMLLACVQATPQQQAALDAMFDMTTAMTGFQGKMIKAYGADALAKINMKDGSGIPKAAEIEKKLKVAETGDTALATMEGESKPLKLVKVGGSWKIDASAMMGAEAAQTEQMIAMSKIMVKIVEEISQSIGKPGTTPESINEEMGKKIMGAMAAMAPKGGQAMPKAPEVPEAPFARDNIQAMLHPTGRSTGSTSPTTGVRACLPVWTLAVSRGAPGRPRVLRTARIVCIMPDSASAGRNRENTKDEEEHEGRAVRAAERVEGFAGQYRGDAVSAGRDRRGGPDPASDRLGHAVYRHQSRVRRVGVRPRAGPQGRVSPEGHPVDEVLPVDQEGAGRRHGGR
jgi:flagellar motor protein MotB